MVYNFEIIWRVGGVILVYLLMYFLYRLASGKLKVSTQQSEKYDIWVNGREAKVIRRFIKILFFILSFVIILELLLSS